MEIAVPTILAIIYGNSTIFQGSFENGQSQAGGGLAEGLEITFG